MANDARAGTQIGQGVYAFVKFTPLEANLSRLGVLTKGWPTDPNAFA